jgi:hypothetical protein
MAVGCTAASGHTRRTNGVHGTTASPWITAKIVPCQVRAIDFANRTGNVVSSWHEKVRSGRRAAGGLSKLRESARRMQLMQHVAIDIDEIPPVGALRH